MAHAHRILITGGAGFIGSFLVDQLIEQGHEVRVMDALDPQVHTDGNFHHHRNPHAHYIHADVRDLEAVKAALDGIEVVYHQAAAVGVSQSQQQVEHYVDVNVRGTATLYQALIDRHQELKRIVVAGSMSSFGEGAYTCRTCGGQRAEQRPAAQLARGQWDPVCPRCGQSLSPVPTAETLPALPSSIYALTKKGQEDIALNMAVTYNWPTVVLRYFNAYGPRQALGNPYTGVLAIFANRLLNDAPPMIYEDGAQLRDFVSVHDVVQANLKAMTCRLPSGRAELINVGSGQPLTIAQVARLLAERLEKPIEAQVLGKYRVGDVRHCFADIAKAKAVLGYEPKHTLQDSVDELIEWAVSADRQADRLSNVVSDFSNRGLVR